MILFDTNVIIDILDKDEAHHMGRAQFTFES
jgi:predicted nucleic acid-binding protein